MVPKDASKAFPVSGRSSGIFVKIPIVKFTGFGLKMRPKVIAVYRG